MRDAACGKIVSTSDDCSINDDDDDVGDDINDNVMENRDVELQCFEWASILLLCDEHYCQLELLFICPILEIIFI